MPGSASAAIIARASARVVAMGFSVSTCLPARRAWTGAKRLNISSRQLASLPDADSGSFIGYGTVTGTTTPRFGPGTLYAAYGDRDLYRGNQVALIGYENGYYLAECYHTDGHILRAWIPASSVS